MCFLKGTYLHKPFTWCFFDLLQFWHLTIGCASLLVWW
jgi:hypothetical protein